MRYAVPEQFSGDAAEALGAHGHAFTTPEGAPTLFLGQGWLRRCFRRGLAPAVLHCYGARLATAVLWSWVGSAPAAVSLWKTDSGGAPGYKGVMLRWGWRLLTLLKVTDVVASFPLEHFLFWKK